MTATLVTVTGTYTDARNIPRSGTIYLRPAATIPNTVPPRIVTQSVVYADLDTDGKVTLQVVASDDPDWGVDRLVLYEVTERISQLPVRVYYAAFPGPGPIDLATIQPVDDPQTMTPLPVWPDDLTGWGRIVTVPQGDPLPVGLPQGTVIVRY